MIALILQQVVLRENPEEVGCAPDNDLAESKEALAAELEAVKEAEKNSPWVLKNLIKSPEAWFLVLAAGFINFISIGIMTNAAALLISIGLAQYIGLILTLVSVFACFGSWLIGVIDQHFGTKVAIYLSGIFMVLCGIIALVAGMVGALIALAFMAIFMGGSSNIMTSGVAFYFGRANFNRVYGITQPGQGIIYAAGSVVVSLLSGGGVNFIPVFYEAIVAGIIVTIVGFAIKNGRVQKQEEKFRAEMAAKANS